MKAWAYEEITKAAEENIRLHAESAEEHAADDFLRLTHLNFAWGAYLLWKRIAYSDRKPGDDERLVALTKLPESSGYVPGCGCALPE